MSWIADAHADWHAANLDNPGGCPLDCAAAQPPEPDCWECGATDEPCEPGCPAAMEATMSRLVLTAVPVPDLAGSPAGPEVDYLALSRSHKPRVSFWQATWNPAGQDWPF